MTDQPGYTGRGMPPTWLIAVGASARCRSRSRSARRRSPSTTAQTVLITDPNGQVTWPSDKGLYFFDTRLISAWAIYANGEPWDLLNGGATTYDTARIFLTNRSFLTEDGTVPARSLGFVIGRRLAGGMHEDLDITNHGRTPVRFNLEIAIRSDFADVFEVKSGRIVRRGRITTEWSDPQQKLRTDLSQPGLPARACISARGWRTRRAAYANGRLSFEVRLDPDRPGIAA